MDSASQPSSNSERLVIGPRKRWGLIRMTCTVIENQTDENEWKCMYVVLVSFGVVFLILFVKQKRGKG